jgi:hypothetical protein
MSEIETEETGAMSGAVPEDGSQDPIGTVVLMNVTEDPVGRYLNAVLIFRPQYL